MKLVKNPVQTFIQNVVRWGIAIPLWYWLVWPIFSRGTETLETAFHAPPRTGQVAGGIILTLLILWFAHTIAKMFNIIPEWERIVLLRLGKSVGARGPGFVVIPPFIYSIARVVDMRIITYEVKATKTLTNDNIPIDVIAAVEMEIEDPEKAAIRVRDYWKTTEWASMEALKSSIGKNNLRPLLSDTEDVAVSVKAEIDEAAKDFGVNVRAVRITDISAPPTLIEELAVIARAERSAKAKLIEAEAEKAVADQLVQASRTLASQQGTMELRQIQALLEISKEESSTIIIYPMDSFAGQGIANSAAGTKASMEKTTTAINPEGQKAE